MPDPFEFLRLRNLFPIGGPRPMDEHIPGMTPPYFPEGTRGAPAPDSPRGMQQPMDRPPDISQTGFGGDETTQMMERMKQLYQPETRAQDQLYKMMETMPTRNKPGKLRQIGGIIAQGLGGGPEAREQITYGPYHQQMQDWGARFGPLEKVADDERANNAILRQIAAGVMTNEAAGKREERLFGEGQARIRQGDERLRQGDERIAQASERLEIAREVSLGGTLEFDDRGNGMIVRKDGSTKPISVDLFSPQEKMALQAKYSKEVAQVPRTTVTSGTTTTITPPTPQPPTQQKTALSTAAESLKNKYPDTIGKYITLGASGTDIPPGDYRVTPIKGGMFGENASYYIQQLIEEEAKKIAEAGGPRVSTSERSSTSTSARGGAAPVAPRAAAPVQKMRKEIPGHPGKFAVSSDGGKTWKAE